MRDEAASDPATTDTEPCANGSTANVPQDCAHRAADADLSEVRLDHPRRWMRVVAFGLLPALALLLAAGAGYLKWADVSANASQASAAQLVRVATEDTIAMLSYRHDTVEKDLAAARDRMTGQFRESYTHLISDVVIPGAKQQRISATATVPAAASMSTTSTHAVVLLFVDQTVNIGDDPPTATASSVRVTLDKVDGLWLVSQFEPV